MTLGDAFVAFRQALEAGHYALATREHYRCDIERFLHWLAADALTRDLTSVTRRDVERYQAHLAGSGLSKQTQASRVRAVKRFFEWQVERGFLFQSPTQGIVETPAGMRKLPQVLTEKEVRRLLSVPNTATPTGLRARAVLELLYSTGMRRGELVALDVADVDLAACLVKIRSGKGRKGRVVPFGRDAKHWLREYVTTVRPRKQRAGRGVGADRRRDRERAFFLDRSGRRLSGKMVHRIVTEAAREAGVRKRCHVHALRHACATHMIAEGADIVTVQRQLGHADPGITSAVYTRVYPKALKEEHQRTHPDKDRAIRPLTLGSGTSETEESDS